jgi:hypothetical protein
MIKVHAMEESRNEIDTELLKRIARDITEYFHYRLYPEDYFAGLDNPPASPTELIKRLNQHVLLFYREDYTIADSIPESYLEHLKTEGELLATSLSNSSRLNHIGREWSKSNHLKKAEYIKELTNLVKDAMGIHHEIITIVDETLDADGKHHQNGKISVRPNPDFYITLEVIVHELVHEKQLVRAAYIKDALYNIVSDNQVFDEDALEEKPKTANNEERERYLDSNSRILYPSTVNVLNALAALAIYHTELYLGSNKSRDESNTELDTFNQYKKQICEVEARHIQMFATAALQENLEGKSFYSRENQNPER